MASTVRNVMTLYLYQIYVFMPISRAYTESMSMYVPVDDKEYVYIQYISL